MCVVCVNGEMILVNYKQNSQTQPPVTFIPPPNINIVMLQCSVSTQSSLKTGPLFNLSHEQCSSTW